MTEQSAEIAGTHEPCCNPLCGPDGHYLSDEWHVREEFGVMEDRTERGLGVLCLAVCRSEEAAFNSAAGAIARPGAVVYVQRRVVAYTDWQRVTMPE